MPPSFFTDCCCTFFHCAFVAFSAFRIKQKVEIFLNILLSVPNSPILSATLLLCPMLLPTERFIRPFTKHALQPATQSPPPPRGGCRSFPFFLFFVWKVINSVWFGDNYLTSAAALFFSPHHLFIYFTLLGLLVFPFMPSLL